MTEQPFTTPILFLIFNRPDTTAQVFEKIRAIKPKHLYVAADGPRPSKPNEAALCQQARELVLRNIDWECELHTRFLDENLGCKMAVSSAITWFFENVEEGIILEDDCLPDISFFGFCAELLKYYRNEERIMHIGGANFQDGQQRGTGSYYFSTLAHIWGWATWKRAWNKYDVSISSYPEIIKGTALANFPNSRMKKFWIKRFKLAYENRIDTWDIQWQFALTANQGLAIIPNVNLVSNIGFSSGATHTHDEFNPLANVPSSSMHEIIHPPHLAPTPVADIYSFRIYFAPSKARKAFRIMKGIFLQLKRKLLRSNTYGTMDQT